MCVCVYACVFVFMCRVYVCGVCVCVYVCGVCMYVCVSVLEKGSLQSHSPVLTQGADWDESGQSVNRGGKGETGLQALGTNWVEMAPLRRCFRNLI